MNVVVIYMLGAGERKGKRVGTRASFLKATEGSSRSAPTLSPKDHMITLDTDDIFFFSSLYISLVNLLLGTAHVYFLTSRSGALWRRPGGPEKGPHMAPEVGSCELW